MARCASNCRRDAIARIATPSRINRERVGRAFFFVVRADVTGRVVYLPADLSKIEFIGTGSVILDYGWPGSRPPEDERKREPWVEKGRALVA